MTVLSIRIVYEIRCFVHKQQQTHITCFYITLILSITININERGTMKYNIAYQTKITKNVELE
jgi:hypothetical protein